METMLAGDNPFHVSSDGDGVTHLGKDHGAGETKVGARLEDRDGGHRLGSGRLLYYWGGCGCFFFLGAAGHQQSYTYDAQDQGFFPVEHQLSSFLISS
jgi:hypothetical protein